ncbi:MAG TPA: Asp-tRNA(Asn)/Glu-tRNA(Gln) amidotransferase GatCAB subunit B, partial [Methanocorpusculum sp.]|nr:Asp-tRNA(Asn)/Glu-tRNA(Gln) amidotransferase GatCAB subunit B [Methanocorpusculum sp.]
ITRQKNLIRRGGDIIRETRHFQDGKGTTISARSKENATDYRYFPEPDLPVIHVATWIKNIALPELPDSRRNRFVQQYGLSINHARTLTGELKLAEFFESVANVGATLAASWIADILIGELNYRNMELCDVAAYTQEFKDLITLIRDKKITENAGIEVLRVWLNNLHTGNINEKPVEIVNRLGLSRESSESFRKTVEQILTTNSQAVSDYKSGKKNALNFIVGQVMKETKGKSDPREIHKMIETLVGD